MVFYQSFAKLCKGKCQCQNILKFEKKDLKNQKISLSNSYHKIFPPASGRVRIEKFAEIEVMWDLDFFVVISVKCKKKKLK